MNDLRQQLNKLQSSSQKKVTVPIESVTDSSIAKIPTQKSKDQDTFEDAV